MSHRGIFARNSVPESSGLCRVWKWRPAADWLQSLNRELEYRRRCGDGWDPIRSTLLCAWKMLSCAVFSAVVKSGRYVVYSEQSSPYVVPPLKTGYDSVVVSRCWLEVFFRQSCGASKAGHRPDRGDWDGPKISKRRTETSQQQ